MKKFGFILFVLCFICSFSFGQDIDRKYRQNIDGNYKILSFILFGDDDTPGVDYTSQVERCIIDELDNLIIFRIINNGVMAKLKNNEIDYWEVLNSARNTYLKNYNTNRDVYQDVAIQRINNSLKGAIGRIRKVYKKIVMELIHTGEPMMRLEIIKD